MASTTLLCLAVLARPPATGSNRPLRGRCESNNQDEHAGWYGKWLNEVVPYIITASERAEFERLTTDRERQQFIVKFWERRNPNPGSSQNLFKEKYERLLAYAKQHYHYLMPGWSDDRARIYIQYGPPDEIEVPPKMLAPSTTSGPSAPVVEQWTYRHINGVKKNVAVQFTHSPGTREYHVVTDPAAIIDHTPSAGPPRHSPARAAPHHPITALAPGSAPSRRTIRR